MNKSGRVVLPNLRSIAVQKCCLKINENLFLFHVVKCEHAQCTLKRKASTKEIPRTFTGKKLMSGGGLLLCNFIKSRLCTENLLLVSAFQTIFAVYSEAQERKRLFHLLEKNGRTSGEIWYSTGISYYHLHTDLTKVVYLCLLSAIILS